MSRRGSARLALLPLTVAALATASGCWHAPAPLGPEGRTRWAEGLLPPAASVGEGRCPAEPLDEAAVIARVAGHPELRVADARARATEAAVDTPRERDPELRVGKIQLDEVIDGGPTFGVGVRARFERPGTLSAREHEATLEARVAQAERDELALTLASGARLAHARLIAAQADLAVRDRLVTLAEARADRAARAARAGAATRVDADLATLDLASAREAAARARADVDAEARALGDAVGAPAGCSVSARGDLGAWEAPAELPAVDALTRLALSRRAVVAAAAAEVERGTTRRFVAGRERWPWFDFAQLEYVTGDLDPERWGLTLGISLPIFRLGDGQVAAADAEVALARARAERDVRSVASQVASARAAVDRANARLAAAREALASYPEARIEALREAAEARTASPDAAVEVEEARLALTRREIAAALALREALIALDAATGAPLAP